MHLAVRLTFCGILLAPSLAIAQEIGPDHAEKMTRGLEVFKKHVKQTLVEKCLKCHGGKNVEGEFDLATRELLLQGGKSGVAIIPGRGRDSLLYKLIEHAKEPPMPFEARKLPDEAVARIAEWIDLGAPYDDPLVPGKVAGAWTKKVVPSEAREFWSYQPLRSDCKPPEGLSPESIDGLVQAKLQAAGLKPNPPATRRQLIRRAYFDLVGLPPPAEEVEAFVNDASPDAYSRLLDRLLASPRHGERWARHWLDLVRFGESHGFEHDYDRPSAYHYRDFVIQALNEDMPYDQFVRWQIAGDELAPNDNLALKATGFLAAGVHSTQITKNEVEKHRYDEMDDVLATIGTSMLGLTIGCARCHDHKYDAIPQADYYRLLATFTTTVRAEIDMNLDPEGYGQALAAFEEAHRPFVEAVRQYEAATLPEKRARLEAALAGSPARGEWAVVDALTGRGLKTSGLLGWQATADPEWLRLKSAEWEHARKKPKPRLVKALISTEGLPAVRLHTQGEDYLPETHYLRRGDPALKEGVAQQGFLQVLGGEGTAVERWRTSPPAGSKLSFRRTTFANWLTDVDHGAGALLARVIVNRLWQRHLGRGIVASPSDFGVRGEPPSHPELLDSLAHELIRNGWRLKPIHKLIMLSATYQQSADFDETKAAVDRENRLFWRRARSRLEAEVLRDAMLALSGQMDLRQYGPGTLDENSKRRSIYFTVKRSKLIPMMAIFDAPDALAGLGERPTTTIAPQALLLMNNPQVRGYARSFASRIGGQDETPLAEVVKRGYAEALARQPSADELADHLAFLNAEVAAYRASGKANARLLAITDFCQVLFCLNEFAYVE